MVKGALNNFRVIDLSSYIAGPFCARLFGDYGADVVKVEHPGSGDMARSFGPFFKDDPHPEKSLLFLYLNYNKRGITLDLDNSSGRKLFKELIKSADALIEDFAPGYLEERGLGYDSLAAVNPDLVMTSITPFGQTGPYKNYPGNHIVYEALGGVMYTSGASDRAPLAHGHPQSLYIGGVSASQSTSAALFARNQIGCGQHVDVSLTEVVAAHHTGPTTRYAYTGEIERRAPHNEAGSPKGGAHFEGVIPVKDGFVGATFQRGAGRRGTLADYLRLVGRPDLIKPEYEEPLPGPVTDEQDQLLLSVLKNWGKYEYFTTAASESWVAAVVQNSEDLANNPHLHERGFYTEMQHPVVGKIQIPGEIFRLPESSFKLRYPTPLLGQHNIEVYGGDLGYSREDLIRLRQLGAL